MNLDTFCIILAIIQLITLICFLTLCNNVFDIKKRVVPNCNFKALFLLYCSVGDKEKAKSLLLKEISMDNDFGSAFYSNYNRANAQQAIIKKYGTLANMIGVTIDFDVVDSYLKSIL